MSLGPADDDRVFEGIAALVAAGEYRDELLGVPGEALSGAAVLFTQAGATEAQRVYSRGSPEHLHARAEGLVQKLPPLVPAPVEAVDEVERLIGAPLPSLLRRLYLEVGNGGFGPGYGVLGLSGGHIDDGKRTATDLHRAHEFPPQLLPICYWGCAIYTLIEPVRNGLTWGFDPNSVEDVNDALFPQSLAFTGWLSRWLAGSLEQPWAVQDAETGRWRGATDEEYAQAYSEI